MKDRPKSISITRVDSTDSSVDIHCNFLPGSYNFIKNHAVICIYECSKLTNDLKSSTCKYVYLKDCTSFDSENVTITLSDAKNSKGEEVELEFKDNNLYAIGVCVGNTQSDNKNDLICIEYFWKGSINNDVHVPDFEPTKIKLNDNGHGGAVFVSYSVPEFSPGGTPNECKHSVKIYEAKQNNLFNNSHTLNQIGETIYIELDQYENNSFNTKIDKRLLFSGRDYSIAYCHEDISSSVTDKSDIGTGVDPTSKGTINCIVATTQFKYE